MIHGVRLEGGRAVWYRNRYVRTPLFEKPEAMGMNADGTPDMTASLANTHVVCHAGRVLALEEGHFPWVVSKELDTIGPHDFGGKLKTAMTAHPRICPETGELLFFGYAAVPPYRTYHRFAKDGTLVQSEAITVKGPTMMHDWNVTRNQVVFMDLPMVFDLSQLAKGGIPIHWSDDYGARLDVARFKKLAFGPNDTGGTPALLHRWVIDTKKRTVRDIPLDDRPADFPRVADAKIGLKHRFGYMTGLGRDIEKTFGRELYKYDLESGKSETWATTHLRVQRRSQRQRPGHPRREAVREGPGRARRAALPRAVRLPRELDRGLTPRAYLAGN